MTWRYHGKLYHIGIGRTHARTHVLLLATDRRIRIIDAATGELLRDLELDPARNYQPTGKPPGLPPGTRLKRNNPGGEKTARKVVAEVDAARRPAWAAIEARHGGLPGVRVADRVLAGVTCIRLDAFGSNQSS